MLPNQSQKKAIKSGVEHAGERLGKKKSSRKIR